MDLNAINQEPPSAPLKVPRRRRRKLVWWVLGGVLALIVIVCVTAGLWYMGGLQPRSPGGQDVRFQVKSGMTTEQIATQLETREIIKNAAVFQLYVRLNQQAPNFQAGVFSVSAGDDVPTIVSKLTDNKPEEIAVTFYPGAVLKDTTATPEQKKTDATTVLKRAGFAAPEIEAALQKTYDHPLFATKPATADLEGYIYGDTYFFDANATVEQILMRTFDEMYAVVQKEDLVNKFKQQGLTLYEGITLASIVQREVSKPADQKQVARIFFNRLKQDMSLGSDVTYHYIADKQGIKRDFRLESPYNTRLVKGLPPGPIAAPGLSALQAVANPAKNDYLYFISGDDDVTYYAKDQAGHDRNIRDHCAYKCSLD